jgi:hypothetical protein
MAALRIISVLLATAACVPGAEAQQRRNPPNHPGQQLLGKLSQMTPAQREKALSKLPAARREQLAQRIENFQQLPPAEQTRRLDRLERLNSLPAPQQKQVRQSMKDFNQLPQERKKQLNQELRRIAALPDDQRRERLNSEEFRNRYSPAEQQMMGDLAELLPSKE